MWGWLDFWEGLFFFPWSPLSLHSHFYWISYLHSSFHLQCVSLTHTSLNITDPGLCVEKTFLNIWNKGHGWDWVEYFTLNIRYCVCKKTPAFSTTNRPSFLIRTSPPPLSASIHTPTSDLLASSLEFYWPPNSWFLYNSSSLKLTPD